MKLQLDPDRLFPADPATRDLARGLYEQVAALPILSPHGHVSPALFVNNESFTDPAEIFIRDDHYVLRVLHSAGIGLNQLGLSGRDEPDVMASPREVWHTFCAHWHLYAGTASGYWLMNELNQIFGIDVHPSVDTADRIFDTIVTAFRTEEFRPRALFSRFGIEVLATTDDPMDDLAEHAALRDDQSFTGRVLPTFRPDAYLDPATTGWSNRISNLAEWYGVADSSYQGYIEALEARRHYFIVHGAVSSDLGVFEPYVQDLKKSDAGALFGRALKGTLSAAESRVFAGHMLFEMARMSVTDGLVMTLHPGSTATTAVKPSTALAPIRVTTFLCQLLSWRTFVRYLNTMAQIPTYTLSCSALMRRCIHARSPP